VTITQAPLDIIIPVYNEAENIVNVLETLSQYVNTPFRLQLCYDHDSDTTLPAAEAYLATNKMNIVFTKNKGKGPHSAIMSGFENATGEAVLVFPGDDTYNARIVDAMFQSYKTGNQIVAASRFMKGGSMKGCPLLKAILVRTASFTLNWFAFIPIKDASNGFRLFSKRLIDHVAIESNMGFTYSIELLVKCHRLRWKIGEVPSTWVEREKGKSNFKVLKWLPHYLKWYFYGFKTTYLGLTHVELNKINPIKT
jgi:dolichol-phosphate mannosyltransferase